MAAVKEIGSDFNIPLNLLFSKKKNKLPEGALMLSSGRDCLEYIISDLRLDGKNVLLPSYLCSSIVNPFEAHNMKVVFFKINKRLEVDVKDFEDKIMKHNINVALIISYFGFAQSNLDKLKDICRKNNVIIIEDKVQSFLSQKASTGNIEFNSYRKMMPVPDGSFLIGIKNNELRLRKDIRHMSFVYLRFIGAVMKNFRFIKIAYRPILVFCEEKLIAKYSKPAAMSKLSKYILKRIDIEEVKSKRRKNYLYLMDNIKENKGIQPIFREINDNEVPLGFPIICKNRDKTKALLIKNSIYPPVHWDLPQEVDKKEFRSSWDISKSILTLPIDQRYGREDMKRIVRVLKDVSI